MVETTEEYRNRINQLKTSIENEPYIKKMREDIAEGIYKTGNRQADIEIRQDILEDDFVAVQQDASSVSPSGVEVAVARAGFNTLDERLTTKEQEVNEQLAQTMTQTEFDSWVATLLDGGPSIFKETYAALVGDLPNGASGVALVRETEPARIYVWNGTKWEDFGAYQGIEIKKGTVTPETTTFFEFSKNLFNKMKVTQGYYVSSLNGNLTANASYSASDYIKVSPNTSYFRNQVHQMAFYNIDKVFISGNSADSVIVSPSNAVYMRITVMNIETFQVEEGTIGTAYEPFFVKLPIAKLGGEKSVDEKMLQEQIVDARHTKFMRPSYNLFNKSLATDGKYVAYTFGGLGDNADYTASDFIEIKPSTVYSLTNHKQLAFYTNTKAYISGLPESQQTSFTTPANAKYVRLSVLLVDKDTFMFSEGSTLPLFEPYGKKYFSSDVSIGSVKTDEFLLFLPSEICIAVGRTIELYNKQVAWCGNINNYHFKWTCAVGKSMKRKWTHTGVAEKIGSYPLTLTVYNNNMEIVATASTTVKIVPATVDSTVNLLPIGDSLTNGKPWLAELKNLSNNMINFVGTRTLNMLDGEGHEGRSGVKSDWYLLNSSYSFDSYGVGTENPFWNPNTQKFDLAYYKTTYGKNPNAVQLFLGTNGISIDPTYNANSIKSIVDGIRETDATIPIFVVNTLFRGSQNGIGNQLSTDGFSAGSGIWKLEEDRKVFNLMVMLNELLKNYSNVHLVPIGLTHDSENNFKNPDISTPLNPRTTITEIQDTEATHPQTAGYLQMADVMFSTMVAYL